MAKGSFVYKPVDIVDGTYHNICFQLKYKYNFELFKCIQLYFNINKGLSINKDKYIQLNIFSMEGPVDYVDGTNDIQNIIIFFNNNKLLGYKLLQYNI